MSGGMIALLAVLGIGAVGTVAYVVATQAAGPAGQSSGANVTLQNGTTQTFTASVTGQVTIGIPKPPAGGNATWVSLTDPNGNAVDTTKGPIVSVPAVTGTYTGVWLLNHVQQTGSVAITAQIPPSGA